MKDYKQMSNKKVNLYLFISDNCPIKFIKEYIDKKLQIEFEYTIDKACKILSKSIFVDE